MLGAVKNGNHASDFGQKEGPEAMKKLILATIIGIWGVATLSFGQSTGSSRRP